MNKSEDPVYKRWLRKHRRLKRLYEGRGGGHNAKTDRNREMVRLKKEEDLTLREIGDRYDISKARVHQVIQRETSRSPRQAA